MAEYLFKWNVISECNRANISLVQGPPSFFDRMYNISKLTKVRKLKLNVLSINFQMMMLSESLILLIEIFASFALNGLR